MTDGRMALIDLVETQADGFTILRSWHHKSAAGREGVGAEKGKEQLGA